MPSIFRGQWKRGLGPALGVGAATSFIFLLAIVNYRKTGWFALGAQALAWFAIPAAVVLLLYAIGLLKRSP